jgi:hypothetical protein
VALAAALAAAAAPAAADTRRTLVPGDSGIVVAGPPGFCTDPFSIAAGPQGAVALPGPCEAGGTGPGAVPVASVAAGTGLPLPLADSGVVLANSFATDAGRAALSRSGRAATVDLLETSAGNGVFRLRLRDSSAFAGPLVEPVHVRALFELRGTLVRLNVLSPRGARPEPAAADALLFAFVAAMRGANRPDGTGRNPSVPLSNLQ